MGFGMRMWTLWRLRAGVSISVACALLAAVWSLEEVQLMPPKVTPRALEMGTASTQLLVDTPMSALLDLRRDTYTFEGLRNRAVLLGNVMASAPVREDIARRAHVPLELLQVAAPRTVEQPRAAAGAGGDRKTSDIVRSTDYYRVSIHANPTVPILTLYTQAPDARSAEAIANASVEALQSHVAALARRAATPEKDQIRLTQMGRARGAVINKGVRWQAALLAFGLTFGACCATVILISRVRAGWQLAAAQSESAPAA
jgi:hypothetical protein